MAAECGEEAHDGLAAGAVGGEDLGEEEPEGGGRSEETVALGPAEVVGQLQPAGGGGLEVVERCAGQGGCGRPQRWLGARHDVSFFPPPEALPF